MSFTLRNQPSAFTPFYGAGVPVHYHFVYGKTGGQLHIDDLHLRTNDGNLSVSYKSKIKPDGTHRIDLANGKGKILGQVTFGEHDRVEVMAPGPDGKLAPASPAAAVDLLTLTHKVLSHEAVIHAGEKIERGMTGALATAAHAVVRATEVAKKTLHEANLATDTAPGPARAEHAHLPTHALGNHFYPFKLQGVADAVKPAESVVANPKATPQHAAKLPSLSA